VALPIGLANQDGAEKSPRNRDAKGAREFGLPAKVAKHARAQPGIDGL
jgi:hypothetical protein